MDVISGKIAIVTGGASGIGAAYVKRLFKSGMKGCTIADVDDQGEATAKEINCCYGKNKAIFVRADVSDQKQFENVFIETMKKFQRLDVLVNNAGIASEKAWRKLIDINAAATVSGSLLGIKFMGKNNGHRGGTIVNTSSIGGLMPLLGFPVYTGTKHFVIGFTRSIGSKFWYDLTGIRFMTICPGVTFTKMAEPRGIEKGALEGFEGLGRYAASHIQSLETQTAEEVADSLNVMLNQGENGSIWVSQGNDPVYQVEIPKIHDMRITNICDPL